MTHILTNFDNVWQTIRPAQPAKKEPDTQARGNIKSMTNFYDSLALTNFYYGPWLIIDDSYN